MKHIKKFENDNVDILRDLLLENPLHETHDFYIFIASYLYEETEGGLFKRILNIENMVRITPDEQSLSSASMLDLRARYQSNSKVYHIWLPQEIREDVEGKGSSSMDSWLVELIDKYKSYGADDQGKQVYKDVLQRKKDIDKYNL
jgi:hypothetical protein